MDRLWLVLVAATTVGTIEAATEINARRDNDIHGDKTTQNTLKMDGIRTWVDVEQLLNENKPPPLIPLVLCTRSFDTDFSTLTT